MNIYKAWRTVKEPTIVNCSKKADILISNNDYIIALEFRVDYIKQNFEHLDLDFEKYLECYAHFNQLTLNYITL